MGRFLRPGWLMLYATVVGVAAWAFAPRFLRKIDFFRVRRVELIGVEYLGQDEVLRGLGLAMDASGRLLPFDPSVAAPDLPLAARSDSLVGRLLGAVRAADPALFGQISSAQRDGSSVILAVARRR